MTHAAAAPDPLERLARLARDFIPGRDALSIGGKVREVAAACWRIEGLGGKAAVADVLEDEDGRTPLAEIVSLDARTVVAIPFNANMPVSPGADVFLRGPLTIAPSPAWFGRVVNAFGAPVDNGGPLRRGVAMRSVNASPPPALNRRLIDMGIATGVKAVDIFTPICVGQRIGLFAGSGVGKSTLLGMLTRADRFDVAVVGLVGERGREVREFVEKALTSDSSKIVVVAATSDESALLRRTAAHTAMAVAEHFRDEGLSVLLVLDSVTRFALACREIAIAAGEPPVSRGFPPSVFTDLPRLLERAGPGPLGRGDITAILSVLVDGDDHNDPIADAVRGIVDGHIVLDRAIAAQGRYPAIDIPSSLSRLTSIALTPERRALSDKFRRMVARFEETRDLRAMGGYQPGVDPDLDTAVAIVPALYASLAQSENLPGNATDAFKEVIDTLKHQFSFAA